MSGGAVGSVGAGPAQSKYIDAGGTYTPAPGQTLDDVAKQWNVPKEELIKLNPQAKNGIDAGMELRLPLKRDSTAGRITVKANQPAPAPKTTTNVDLKAGQGQSDVQKMTNGNGTGKSGPVPGEGARADVNASHVGPDYVKELGKKSPEALQTWYDTAPKDVREAVKKEIDRIKPGLEGKDLERTNALSGNLKTMTHEASDVKLAAYYDKMPKQALMQKFAEMPPKRIMEDLQRLGVSNAPEAKKARQNMIDALGAAIQTQKPYTNPKIPNPMVSPGAVFEAAMELRGNGSGIAKAEVAGMFYQRSQDRAERAYPKLGIQAPEGGKADWIVDKAGGPTAQKIVEKAIKDQNEARADRATTEVNKDAGLYKQLIMSDPAGVVGAMEDMARRPGMEKMMPDVYTAIAKREYEQDPKKGGEILGKISGAVAARYAMAASRTNPSLGEVKARGNDLGASLAASEIAIDRIAKGEKEKVEMGAKILSFGATEISKVLKENKVPHADKISEWGTKAIDWMKEFENGKIDDWRSKIFEGWNKIVDDTYDKVGPNADASQGSQRGQLHENGQDIYETTWQEKYRSMKSKFGS